jgi:hypothetical protein
MASTAQDPAASLADTLRRMAGGFSTTQILYTAVKLGIADQLAHGPRTAVELAQALNADAASLQRFLRMMAVVGLLTQEGTQAFSLAPLGELLRADHPESLRTRILFIGETNYACAQFMLHAVTTGEPAFDRAFGMPFFEYLSGRQDLSAMFQQIMDGMVDERIEGIVAGYDFSSAKTIVDIGGGSGGLLSAILARNRHARGIIFDVGPVVARADERLARVGLRARVDLVAGDFFTDTLPSGGDFYLMSNIIHDWDDARALAILRNCRSVTAAGSRLLLIEEIMPVQAMSAPATVASDFSMLLLTGGRERTEAEYRALLEEGGFQHGRVIPVVSSRIHNGRRPNWAILESSPRL